MRIGSLFSGYSGLDMGVQQVIGGTVAWHCENDRDASKILAHHWPDVPNLGDITTVDWTKVEPVDVLTGGFPCQDVSLAGKREGLKDGTRSGLWSEFANAIDILRPRLVVAENVRGLLSAEAASDLEHCSICLGDGSGVHLRALGAVLGDLAELGYDAIWHGLRAADIGAPHGRFRIFVIAYPQGDPWWLSNGDGAAATDSDSLGRPRLGGAWGGGSGLAHGCGSAADVALLPTPVVNDMGEGKTPQWWDDFTARHAAKYGNNGHGRSLAIEAARLLPTPTSRDNKGHNQRGDTTCLTGALLPTPRATDGTKGGPNQRGSSGDLMLPSAVAALSAPLLPTPSVADAMGGHATRGGARGNELLLPGIAVAASKEAGAIDWAEYAPAIERWESLTRIAPAPTQTSRNGNQQLAPAFVEWMMGLPVGHVTDVDISRNAKLKALGNGVVPQQAAAGVAWCLNRKVTP